MCIVPGTQLELMGQMKAQEIAHTQFWAVPCTSSWTRSFGPQHPVALEGWGPGRSLLVGEGLDTYIGPASHLLYLWVSHLHL